MSANPDPYYLRSECSNSDLSELHKLFWPLSYDFDFSESLRFGTLVDALITEMERVNVYRRSVDDEVYTVQDFELAKAMKLAFYRDPTCAAFAKLSEFQKISAGMVEYIWNSFRFKISMRAKWDGWMPRLKHGYDIKTTTATTIKQFEEACHHFKYFRSRAVYMELEQSNADMLIGISKVNCKIFKIPIVRGDIRWKAGYEDAANLAHSHWQLFSDFGTYNNNLTLL